MVSGYTLKWRHDLPNEIGTIRHIFQYPVKSMAGVCLDTASLGWHGLEGDRRFAFRRAADKSGFPWLTASRLPELLLYKPLRQAELESKHPTHVLTPSGSRDCRERHQCDKSCCGSERESRWSLCDGHLRW